MKKTLINANGTDKVWNASPTGTQNGNWHLFKGAILHTDTPNPHLVPVQTWAYIYADCVDCYLSRSKEKFKIQYL